jgi:RNA polymerase sigma-70 factor (ECF subfamily)
MVANTLTEVSEAELIQRAKQNDGDAFAALVRRHEALVYSLALRFMGNPVAAEDAAQESLLKAFRLLKGFRGRSRFSTWLYRVTCNVCLTELARCKRRGEVPLKLEHLEPSREPDHGQRDMNALVRRCVTQLSERYATILTLYYFEESSYEDIAEAMDIPMGTLKTWMHRARKELRNLVEKELETGGTAKAQ